MEYLDRIEKAHALNEQIVAQLATLRAEEADLCRPLTEAHAVGLPAALVTGDVARLLDEVDPRIERAQQLASVRNTIRKFELAQADLASDVALYGQHQTREAVASSAGDAYRASAQAVAAALRAARAALDKFEAERRALTAGLAHSDQVASLAHLGAQLDQHTHSVARVLTQHPAAR
jgi:hypothetical protein